MSLGFFQQTVIRGNEKFTSGSLGGSDVDTMADLELLAAGKLTGEEYRSRLHARYGGVSG